MSTSAFASASETRALTDIGTDSSGASGMVVQDDFVACANGTTLRFGEEGVIIRSQTNKPSTSDDGRCCGMLPSRNPVANDRKIVHRDILWADASSHTVTLTYVKHVGKQKIAPTVELFSIPEGEVKGAQLFVNKVQKRAYGTALQKKRIKVIINPFGGKGKALKYWSNDIEPIFKAARCEIDVVHTTHHKHAEEIAEALDIDKVDVVACCSGDGVPHEVWNGLGRKTNAGTALGKVAVVQLPCGTGNALSFSCNGTSSPSLAALSVVKGVITPIDLASVTQDDKRVLSFLSQSLGIVAESDLLTEELRWLGDQRFMVGFIKRIFRKTVWPCDIAVGVEIADKNDIQKNYRQSFELRDATAPIPEDVDSPPEQPQQAQEPPVNAGLPPLKYGTINDPLPAGWELTPYPNLGNLYSGNLPFMAADANFFTFARIDDGLLDLVTIRGDVGMAKSIAMMMSVEEGKLWAHPDVTYRKVSGFRIIPKDGESKSVVSICGEKFPYKPFQVEVHKGLGRTLTVSGRYVSRDEIALMKGARKEHL